MQRAFEKCETESDKDQTEQFLKNMLTSHFRDGTAWVVDWDKEPLPRLEMCFKEWEPLTVIIENLSTDAKLCSAFHFS